MNTIVVFLLFLIHFSATATFSKDSNNAHARGLSVEFYRNSCSHVQTVVQNVVWEKARTNRDLPAKLLRLQFHDCFVKGCEGSVLLDRTKKTDQNVEKDDQNNAILAGYDVIDEVKEELEKLCPETVSCSDIIALAARDAVSFQFKKSLWEVPLGRRDGGTTTADDAAANLPPPKFNVSQLIILFHAKGLTFQDLVVLSGSHTIGKARCLAFNSRFIKNDPYVKSTYFEKLEKLCKEKPDGELQVFFDPITPYKFDNNYYKLLDKNLGLLRSDATLTESKHARQIIKALAGNNSLFLEKFGVSMVKMGQIGVLTGDEGEIRQNCRIIN